MKRIHGSLLCFLIVFFSFSSELFSDTVSPEKRGIYRGLVHFSVSYGDGYLNPLIQYGLPFQKKSIRYLMLNLDYNTKTLRIPDELAWALLQADNDESVSEKTAEFLTEFRINRLGFFAGFRYSRMVHERVLWDQILNYLMLDFVQPQSLYFPSDLPPFAALLIPHMFERYFPSLSFSGPMGMAGFSLHAFPKRFFDPYVQLGLAARDSNRVALFRRGGFQIRMSEHLHLAFDMDETILRIKQRYTYHSRGVRGSFVVSL